MLTTRCFQDSAAASRAGSRPLIAAAPASVAAAIAASGLTHPEPDPDHEPSVSKLLLEPWSGARPVSAASTGGRSDLHSWDQTPHGLAAIRPGPTGERLRAQTAGGGGRCV